MEKNEIPTPDGVRTYWAVDYGLAMEVTEEDWKEFGEELQNYMIENWEDLIKEASDGRPST